MTIVEGHEFISLKTPFEETDLPEEKREEYETIKASVEDNDEMLPWFPFQCIPTKK